ncbi:Dipeptidyl peptidase 3 [Hypsibius exemplaris]|uniref:dipeptidyl-peptidase III n=1 Tax=Hypsibius exemplaris TaxID=2072580 RepID=A0A1W0XDA7_HYPEX|nr:Dipeptidyl peptidase 3 [Hypsibius exemplaris]
MGCLARYAVVWPVLIGWIVAGQSNPASAPVTLGSLSVEELKQYYAPLNTPIAFLDGNEAFNKLQPSEKCQVHYLSKASWAGALIDLFQTSPESPRIFVLLQSIFRSKSISALKDLATTECYFTTEDWNSLLVYIATFYANLGNYYSNGMRKFIPQISPDKFECLINSTFDDGDGAANSKAAELLNLSQGIWAKTKRLIYELGPRYRTLGFGPAALTTYFSANCDASDAKLTFDRHNGQPNYEIRFASSWTKASLEGDAKHRQEVDGLSLGVALQFNGSSFTFTRGDYSHLMSKVVKYLEEARNKKCFPNTLEEEMTDGLIRSFNSGSVAVHKNASRLWVKNKNPVIESYMGFIETYQDPDGMRGSFEGVVAIVDKAKTAVLTRLVDHAEEFLRLLPWPREFEKDKFLKPDYTDLTVISYANGWPPSAINIPNYNEIRQNEGFKNVNLGNAIAATLTARPLHYLSASDEFLLKSNRTRVFDVIVGLHELLGHGSGKLFHEFANGSFDFDIATIGNVSKFGAVNKWYRSGETLETKFGRLGNVLEECRAETVAVYLSLFPEVLKIWGVHEKNAEEFSYTLWLEEAFEGLDALSLAQVSADTVGNSWGEAHAPGLFAILRVMIESGVANVTVINGTDGKPDMLIRLDRKRILTDGKRAMGDFLLDLQFFMSTGDVEGAEALYNRYTSLKLPENQRFIQWHKIAVARRKPNPLLVQPNTVLLSDSLTETQTIEGAWRNFPKIQLKNYNATAEGMIQSFLDRYTDPAIDGMILALAEADLDDFAV